MRKSIFIVMVMFFSVVMAEKNETTQMVYDILRQQYGQKTISCTVARIDWNATEAGYVFNWTGKWPVMNTYDYISSYGSWIDYNDMTVLDSWWNCGGLVGCMWHWNMKANNGTDYTCTPGTEDKETSFDCSRISDTTSDEYKQVIADIDKVAESMKLMKDLDIPIIWRPLHEASGNTCQYEGGAAWFWWGAKGATAYKNLWRILYDRLANHHGLDNLIWVWTSQTNDGDWYPGDEYVDIIARDGYGMSGEPIYNEYKSLSDAYPDKMITLGECGSYNGKSCATMTEMWDAGCRWSWFMPWYDSNYNGGDTHLHSGKAWWQDAMSNANVINRDGMADLRAEYVKESSNQDLSLTNLDAGWNATSTSSATGATIIYTADWGAKGWSNLTYPSVEKGKVKLVIEFAEAPAVRGTIEGDGIVNAGIIVGQRRYVMSVTSASANIGQVLVKAETAGTQYKLAKVYLTRWENTSSGVDAVTGSRILVPDGSYNLAGQKVNENANGIIIENGKKVIR